MYLYLFFRSNKRKGGTKIEILQSPSSRLFRKMGCIQTRDGHNELHDDEIDPNLLNPAKLYTICDGYPEDYYAISKSEVLSKGLSVMTNKAISKTTG